MKSMNKIAQTNSDVSRGISCDMQGDVVSPADDNYAQCRAVWNGAVSHHPLAIAQCQTTQDVQAVVRLARSRDLRVSVRGGGHDWAGRSMCDGGVVIDLSAMRGVEVDATDRVATVQGGARATDLAAAAAPHGLAAVTGNAGSVGLAGLTLGGGYGPLTPRYGLALDNLLGADVVLADGRCVTADARENRELFWALRGGGGNFGVVTAMRLRLHPVRELQAGIIVYPWWQAELVLRRYAEWVTRAPDAMSVTAAVLASPDGEPALVLAPTWCGAPQVGEPLLQGLQCLGTPLLVQMGAATCPELLGMYEAHAPAGRHYALQTRWLPALTADVIAAIIAAGGARTSPFSSIVLHHFHGAPTRVAANATAFGLRQEHFLLEVIAAWEPDARADGGTHREWARRLSQAIAPASLPGGYPNLLAAGDHDQIAAAYGGNVERLRATKRRYDPDGVFTATPLPL